MAKNENCILGITPGDGWKCITDAECRTCGWNPTIAEARLKEIRVAGLTKNKCGLSRFIIKRHQQKRGE